MKRTFAKAWCDALYHVNFMVIRSAPQDFHPTVARLLQKTSLRHESPAILRKLHHSLDGCSGRTWRLPHRDGKVHLIVIWLRPTSGYSTLVHELWHAAFWVFQQRGVVFDDGADEPMAYYLSWLIDVLEEE